MGTLYSCFVSNIFLSRIIYCSSKNLSIEQLVKLIKLEINIVDIEFHHPYNNTGKTNNEHIGRKKRIQFDQ